MEMIWVLLQGITPYNPRVTIQQLLEEMYHNHIIKIFREESLDGIYVELQEKYNDFVTFYMDDPSSYKPSPPITVYLPYYLIDMKDVSTIYDMIEIERKKLLTIDACCATMEEALKKV